MVNKFQKVDYKDIGVRALKTFLQAFGAVFLLGWASIVDWESGKALALASLAAGISAVWNFIKETL